ncbi:unnamed protein product [Medioppia subpectinata]|uniref:Clathrin/coatomer adaptor adaptin-like N-terminal domain-containing protein n=1 Tax=Medioppia subpectinata TaxID=1979941 RepID=A0A7R9KEF2_9ACAR|nr:unnamed protein product [Medioppia subpectinata]CAG2100616.1 unnamed protein product [Medioppia subpectinata]
MSMSSMQTTNYHSENSYDSGGYGQSDGLSGGGMSASGGMTHSYSESNLMGGSGGGSGGLSGMSGSSSRTGMSFLTGGHSASTKHEDLKQMLESNKDGLKLEAMKRIIGMIAKGRAGEAPRELFPHVVKNVVTKNAELKKLVYLYLTRYAEQEQDLALLSIATFQRSLKDPNPLIRASAIRVLSSIRVSIIAPIMLIAIRDCSNDMSPYVRKTAAHAIPKLYSLDPDLKNEIIDIIERLLNDRTSLVLGSAVAAFEEVCPDRFDLIHQNYRKFCSLLVDVDEWGQIILINMLIRYARTQFTDPNGGRYHAATASQSSLDTDPTVLDADHRALLRSAKPLLQSRNSGVVLAVIQMYLSLAPNSELNAIIVKPLIRLLHSHREIQLVVLKNIVSLTTVSAADDSDREAITDDHKNKENADNGLNDENNGVEKRDKDGYDEDDDDEEEFFKFGSGGGSGHSSAKNIKTLFEPHLKSFFIKSKDSTQTKILKLEILTNLSNSANISLILREFQAYINNYQEDLEFMAATIQSIGHIAARIKEIAPICLNGLITLLSNRNETIVSHSIVVIRTQIINKDDTIISAIIKQVVRLMDKIHTPQARATILWILAEFCPVNERAAKYAPDVLRKLAKTFCLEADTVKLQALNLSAKLFITQDTSDRIKLLVNFLFNLAKYDLNYDVRDRGRLLRQLLNDPTLAKRILLVPKCVPDVGGGGVGRADSGHQFRIGTLSHFLEKRAADYEELPDWPLEQPDTSVRARKEVYVEEPTPTFALVNIKDNRSERTLKKLKEKSFYSSEESADESEEDDTDEEEEESDEEEDSDEEISGEEESDDEEEEETDAEDEEEEDGESSGEEEESDDGAEEVLTTKANASKPSKSSNSSKAVLK